ncbi:MAG: mechanosensitive ion channel family protein [Gammaproteobacteria bacterium]|nr:MAG: mechanosensitive ion channel family protein [Gammaproteobacteria bacterium]
METFNEMIKWLTGLLGTETWIIQVFIVVLAMLIINFVQKRALHKLLVKAESTLNVWDDALLSAMLKPLSVLIWVVGLTFAADIVHDNTGATIFEIVPAVRDVGVIISIMWFLVRFIRAGEENVVKTRQIRGEEVDRTTVEAIGKLLRLSVIITGVLVVLQTLGFSISGVLAFGGIGGIAVGFAAKDLLANFFGGLMIYLDRPFAVGDWVRSPDKEIEGTVEDIGWRLTRIRTFDKRPLYVPNSVFASIAVENPSRMTNRRIYETVGIRYDDASKMDVIIKDVKEMLKNHPEIDTSHTLIVNFNKFAPSSLDFFVYTFTKTTEWVRFHEIKQDVLLKIMDIVEQHGAEMAFPTSTLHLASQPIDMPVPPGVNPDNS